MDILPILYHLQAAFVASRQVGHTKFARGIAHVGGVLICADEKSAALFARKREEADTPPKTVSMQDTREVSRLERQGVPLVLDNFAVMKICTEAISRIQQQHEEFQILSRHHDMSKEAWAQELRGLHKVLTDKHKENQQLLDWIKADKIQIQAFELEVLKLKIQLEDAKAAKVVRHIRVTRSTKKRRR